MLSLVFFPAVTPLLFAGVDCMDKIIQNNCKHYYYNDLQLIINEHGDHWCKKDKIFSYNTIKNESIDEMDIRVSLYRTNKIPTEIFPPITEYHDIRKIRKTRFIKKNVYISYGCGSIVMK